MKVVLFDTPQRQLLWPLTLTRPMAELRYGAFSIRERWEHRLGTTVGCLTENYLQCRFPYEPGSDTLFINAAWVSSAQVENELLALPPGSSWWSGEVLLAGRLAQHTIRDYNDLTSDQFQIQIQLSAAECFIRYPWHLLQMNIAALSADIQRLINKRPSTVSNNTVFHTGQHPLWIEEGAEVTHAFINTSEGPVYIARGAVVMDGASIRGPVYIGEQSVLKMGAKVYGATSVGQSCLIGGEVKNSIIHHYSNKAHDGYLGDSILGEWCNMGAGTCTSNVKNTGGVIKMWVPAQNRYVDVGKKCGLMMGDYSRSAINTSFNSGTVTGICSNIFGGGLTMKHIPNFSWGMEGTTRYKLDKALSDIDQWMDFKHKKLSEAEISILQYIYQQL